MPFSLRDHNHQWVQDCSPSLLGSRPIIASHYHNCKTSQESIALLRRGFARDQPSEIQSDFTLSNRAKLGSMTDSQSQQIEPWDFIPRHQDSSAEATQLMPPMEDNELPLTRSSIFLSASIWLQCKLYRLPCQFKTAPFQYAHNTNLHSLSRTYLIETQKSVQYLYTSILLCIIHSIFPVRKKLQLYSSKHC